MMTVQRTPGMVAQPTGYRQRGGGGVAGCKHQEPRDGSALTVTCSKVQNLGKLFRLTFRSKSQTTPFFLWGKKAFEADSWLD